MVLEAVLRSDGRNGALLLYFVAIEI